MATEKRKLPVTTGMLRVMINFRKEHTLNQAEMAILLGIKRSYLGMMEQGQRPVTDAIETCFIRLQVELITKESVSAPKELGAKGNNHLPPFLHLKWTIRAKDLEYKLQKLARRIEDLPDEKERSVKIDKLRHLVTHFEAPEPVKNLFIDKHRNLASKSPIQFRQRKLELEFKAELLRFEIELLEKFLATPAQGE